VAHKIGASQDYSPEELVLAGPLYHVTEQTQRGYQSSPSPILRAIDVGRIPEYHLHTWACDFQTNWSRSLAFLLIWAIVPRGLAQRCSGCEKPTVTTGDP